VRSFKSIYGDLPVVFKLYWRPWTQEGLLEMAILLAKLK
jgi:hypothetical protein